MNRDISVKPANFSVAFEQICNAIAIADAAGSSAVLEALVMQCFLLAPTNTLSDPKDFVHTLETYFGIDASVASLTKALEALEAKNSLLRQGKYYVLAQVKQQELQSTVRRARELEDTVKAHWSASLDRDYPDLDHEEAWAALQRFLAKVFRRHGVYSVRLLSPEFENDDWHDESLQELLRAATSEIGQAGAAYQPAILGFLSGDEMDADRATYIAQLADTAFNYFSLALPPEVTKRFLDRLNGLVLFFDTNALYGLLDLDSKRKDRVQQLVDAIRGNGLQLRMRFHEITLKELKDLIQGQASTLKKRKWPLEVSRAVVTSKQLDGLVLRYHEHNMENQVAVEDFLDPLEHPDALLKQQGLDIYRSGNPNKVLFKKVEYEYQAYVDKLKGATREKSIEAIHHDAVVLATAHQLALEEADSLKTAALLVTFDGNLYNFDRQLSRDLKLRPRAVFPESLLQVLRPHLDAKRDYDEAFARSFAVAEFRSIEGNAEVAANRVASMLARYKDIPEELATRILSNKYFLERISSEQNDDEVAELVEKALADEAKQISVENRELAATNERQRGELESLQGQHAEATRGWSESEVRTAEARKNVQELEREIEEQEARARDLAQENETLKQRASADKRELDDVKSRAKDVEEEARRSKRELEEHLRNTARWRRGVAAAATSLAGAMSLTLASLFWRGLRQHPHYLGIAVMWLALFLFASLWMLLDEKGRRRHKTLVIGSLLAWTIGFAAVLGGASSFSGHASAAGGSSQTVQDSGPHSH